MTSSTIPGHALAVQLRRILYARSGLRRTAKVPTSLAGDLNDLREELTAILWKPFIEAGVPPAACVPLEDYNEEDYRYFADISDDPMWGIDADYSWSTVESYPFALDQLGWYIRITPRTPEGLALLTRMRDWHIQCRAFGLDPRADVASKTLEAFGAIAAARTDDERAAAKATFEQMMRDAVAEEEVEFARDLEYRAAHYADLDLTPFDGEDPRRAKWVKAPETGAAE